MQFFTSFMNALPGAIAQGMIWGIMAIGVYITYKILDIADLTVDGSLCTGGAVCVILTLNGVPMWIALLFAFAAGMIAGFITGVLHTRFGIPAILAGILTQLAIYSINLHIMGWGTDNFSKSNLPISVDKYNLLVSARYVRNLAINNPIWVLIVFLVVIVGIIYWFFGTEIGCSLRATGANGNMARAQGINTNPAKVFGLMISNGLVALSGALLGQYQGFSDINMGRGAIVIGLAAVIIGEVLFGKLCTGRKFTFAYTLFAVAAGAVIYYIVLQVVLALKMPTDDLKLFSAVVVAIFLSLPYLKGKHAAAAKKKEVA